MELGTLFFLLLILACPLMMVWMMRGHGGHSRASDEPGHAHMHGGGRAMSSGASLNELRRRRAELDAEIACFEESETEAKSPAAV